MSASHSRKRVDITHGQLWKPFVLIHNQSPLEETESKNSYAKLLFFGI